MQDIKDLIEAAARLAPRGKRGADGRSPTVRDVADVVLANMERPKDGISPDINAVAVEAAKLIPKPKDGVGPTAEAVASKLPVPKRGERGPKGKDGAAGLDGKSITDVFIKDNELFVSLNGKKKLVGKLKLPAPIALGGGSVGYAHTSSLQSVTDKGNETTNDIILSSADGSVLGRLGSNDTTGVFISSQGETLQDKAPLTLEGSTAVIDSEQLNVAFNGATNGEFMRLTATTDINGKQVFSVGTTPLDTTEYTEAEAFSGADTVLTATHQVIISKLAVDQYRSVTAQVLTSFRLFNTSVTQAATVEYYVTVNGAVPSPSDLRAVTVTSKSGVTVVNFDTTVQNTIEPTDDVQVFAKQLTGEAAAVSVTSSTDTTTLTLIQNATLKNSIQSTQTISASTVLSDRKYYDVVTPGMYSVPEASSIFDINNPFLMSISNGTSEEVSVGMFAGDVIKTTSGNLAALAIPAGGAATILAQGPGFWDIISSYIDTPATVANELPFVETNADYDSAPETALTSVFSVGYTKAVLEVGFEPMSDARNRSVVVGVFMDGNLMDTEFSMEPKDVNNNGYPFKKLSLDLAPGPHTLEVKYGRRGGGGGSFVRIKNIRTFIGPL